MVTLGAVALSALVVVAVCVVLVLHPDYELGWSGVVGLGLIAAAGMARFTSIMSGEGPVVTPLSIFVWGGLAVFLGGLLVRFLRRARARGADWYQGSSKRRTAP